MEKDINHGDKAKLYERIRIRFFLLETFLTLCVVSFFAFFGPSVWLASALEPLAGTGYGAAVLFTSACLLLFTLAFLPLEYAGGFRLEHRFDLSNQTLAKWATEKGKSFFIKLLFTNILAVSILVLLRNTGDHWWIWSGFVWLVFGILLSHLYPVMIMPLFYKIVPLENEILKNRIMEFAHKVKARIVGVYQFNMSKNTKKANALFTGIGRTKRIILGDTLLEKFQDDEIQVILAHEMGHYVRRHVPKQVLASTAMSFAGLWLVHRVLEGAVGWAGIGSVGSISVLPLIGFLLSLLALLTMPITNLFSRYCERQADRFALEQTQDTKAFCRGMKKLASQNLSNPDPHPALEFFLHSHPSIAKRIRAAEAFAAQAIG